MATQTFFLLINEGSVHVTLNEPELPQPRVRSHWQRYKLIVKDGVLVEVEKTDSLVPTPRITQWSHGTSLQQVPVSRTYIMMGKGWRDTITRDTAVQALLRKMRESVPA